MKLTIKTAHGYLSAQPATPGGIARWQYRDVAGEWETFELEGLVFPTPLPPAPTPVPPHPPVPDRGFNLPADAAAQMLTTAGRRGFIMHGLILAFHVAPEGVVVYWLGKADEMIARGHELGEGLRYFWERLLGRGSGGADVAIDGPYAGREHYEGSLTE